MRGRRVRDATSKERHVCARRRDGEPAGSQKSRRRYYFSRPTPSAPRRTSSRGNYVEDFSPPRTTQMLVHRLSQ